ncbi:MAG TPA: hypothetical protein IAC47_04945 [Candidatus Onthomorpha intestinigallinarum]|uniref:Uncharacterized protein n=1 Tax=Candidatus Onthomorpha intestinigallinarum TaxID=2840880 RepID=A0A9D1RHM5_9BACT|nr:hypothetical protein [Candidatus Onthomorpha intestinigallinarum]
MKRVLLAVILVAFCISCSRSPEDKANKLIEEDLKKVLYVPESYDPVETKVDSAFTPFDDPVFVDKTMQLLDLATSIEEYDNNIKEAKSSMSLWDNMGSAFSRNEYQEAKDEYDENTQNRTEAISKAKKLGEELKKMMDKERMFIGYKVQHRYRADNNAGNTLFGEKIYLFDKNMNQIVASYNYEEYKTYQSVCKQIVGEN